MWAHTIYDGFATDEYYASKNINGVLHQAGYPISIVLNPNYSPQQVKLDNILTC